MAPFKTTRECAGSYTVGAPGADIMDTVNVFCLEEGRYAGFWIAKAQWDRCLYTDPMHTKRGAVREALAMLAERNA